MLSKINIYGAQRCHKSQYYKRFFETHGLSYNFLDVEENEDFAQELRNLYDNNALHFPTITINGKRLRNPSEKDLKKWLDKLL